MIDPPIPPARVFATDDHRHAAEAIVATVNLAHDYPDLIAQDEDELAKIYGDLEAELTVLDVVVAASVVVTKLLSDERTVWHVNPRRTIARLGAWVAGDELARGGA